MSWQNLGRIGGLGLGIQIPGHMAREM